jgi:hypothetical protein
MSGALTGGGEQASREGVICQNVSSRATDVSHLRMCYGWRAPAVQFTQSAFSRVQPRFLAEKFIRPRSREPASRFTRPGGTHQSPCWIRSRRITPLRLACSPPSLDMDRFGEIEPRGAGVECASPLAAKTRQRRRGRRGRRVVPASWLPP